MSAALASADALSSVWMLIHCHRVHPPLAEDRRKCPSVKATRAGLAQKARDLAAAQNAIRYTTNETLRWAGIVNKTCPPSLPSHADATSFIVWLYWTAFGQGKDHLTNQEDWQGGGPAIMGLTGRQVSETKGAQLASYAHAQPGDIVFYGTFSKAWPALYVVSCWYCACCRAHVAPGIPSWRVGCLHGCVLDAGTPA